MPYRFKLHEPVDDAVRRIFSEQVARACHELSSDEELAPVAIHDSRKAIKRLRALLRLARPALGTVKFQTHNESLRDIAAALSQARDDDVITETIDKLETHFGSDGVQVLAPLRQIKARAALVKARMSVAAAQAVAERLARENELFAKVDFQADLLTLVAGLRQSYRKAVTALAAACEKPDDDVFHDLRKTVQWHWRQLALISRAWPDYFKVRVDAARDLSQILGDEHDLSLLRAYVVEQADLTTEHQGSIVRMAQARQEELRHEAISRATLLLAERPKQFANRMAKYWAAGRDLQAADGRDARKPEEKTPALQAAKGGDAPKFPPKAVHDQRSKRRA